MAWTTTNPPALRRGVRKLGAGLVTAWLISPGCSGDGSGDTAPTAAVTKITITPDHVEIGVGTTAQLNAIARDAGNAVVPGAKANWVSGNQGVATVSTSGLVTGVAAGSTSVTASVGSAAASVPVSVRATLTVLPDSVTVTAIGSAVPTTITLNGAPAPTAAFTLTREQRWLHDRPVLDAGELAASRIMPYGAGRAVVLVTAGGLSDSIVVIVAPPQPHVFGAILPGGRTHVGSGDTVVLRGYRMHTVTEAQVLTPGVSRTLVPQDSANLRVVVTTLVTSGCTGRAPSFNIQFAGITGQPVGPLTRQRTGEIDVGVGGAQRLSSDQAACIRFAPRADARYLLAYADPRVSDQARTQPEYPWPDSILVAVADQGSQQPSVRLAVPVVPSPTREQPRGGPSAPRGHLDLAMAPAMAPVGCPFANFFFAYCRASPWSLGEVVTHYPFGSSRPAGPARIIAVRGNLVLGIFRADSAMLAGGAIARADSALSALVQRGIPLLQSLFGLSSPTKTSDESGQLYMMIEATTLAGGAMWWPDPPTGHGRWATIVFGVAPTSAFGQPETSYVNALLIIAHEVLHTYQYRYRFEYGSPWLGSLGTLWGVEGAATAFSMEMVREVTGTPFLGNTAIVPAGAGDSQVALTLYGSKVTDLTAGYLHSASFMRDLVQRLVSAGVPFDVALREVVVGSLEGWYGINEEGLQRGQGLAARMRARLGATWNPTEALLDWTMSQAADDLTGNTRYQNLTVRQAQPSPSSNMMPPHAVIVPGSAVSIRRGAGNTGVFELRDDVGGSYRANATVNGASSSALEWLLLRIR